MSADEEFNDDSKQISTDLKPRAIYVWAGCIIFALLFTLSIWLLGPNLNHFTSILLPDKGSSWYYWPVDSNRILWISGFICINCIFILENKKMRN